MQGNRRRRTIAEATKEINDIADRINETLQEECRKPDSCAALVVIATMHALRGLIEIVDEHRVSATGSNPFKKLLNDMKTLDRRLFPPPCHVAEDPDDVYTSSVNTVQ